MKKLFIAVLLAVLAFGFACSSTNHITQQRPSIEQLLSPAIGLINGCSSDTSFNTMAYRASYESTDTCLVVYLGKALEHNDYMWKIPLKAIDKSNLNLFRQDYNVSSVTMNTYGNQASVRYYMGNKLKSKSPQFVLYLGKCFGSDDKDKVLASITNAIFEAQRDLK